MSISISTEIRKNLINIINGFDCDYEFISIIGTNFKCERKNNLPRQIIYNYIDKLVNSESLDLNFNSFKNFLNDYSTYTLDNNADFFAIFSSHSKFYLVYDAEGNLIDLSVDKFVFKERYDPTVNNLSLPKIKKIHITQNFLKKFILRIIIIRL